MKRPLSPKGHASAISRELATAASPYLLPMPREQGISSMARILYATLLYFLALPLTAEITGQTPPPFLHSLAELVAQHGFAAESWLAECRQHLQTGKQGALPATISAPLPRIMQTLRREREAAALRRLHSYRRLRRIPTFAAATQAIAAAEEKVELLKQRACEGTAEAFAEACTEADDRLAAAQDLIDRHWPEDLPIRVGVGADGVGRYGWRPRFGGLVWDLVDWNRLTSPYTASEIRFSPPGATLSERRPPAVTWVSARHECTLTAAGKPVKWHVTESILVPGILVETDATALQFSRGADTQHGPDRVLMPMRDSALSLRFRPGRKLPPPEDNWLLLVWEKSSAQPPVLLVFERLPSQLEWTGQALVVRFSGPANKVALGSYNGTGAWSADTSRSWQAVPRPVLKRCRALAATLSSFPTDLEELFAVDESRGEVRLICRPTYTKFAFSGRIPKPPATPLPPMLSAAAEARFAVKLPQFTQDWALDTRNGPYHVSAGPNATFRLPICRYDHPLAPVPLAAADAPLTLPEPLRLEDLCRALNAWPGLAESERKRLARLAREHLTSQLAIVEGGQACAVEPRSLTLYIDLVAARDARGSAATVRQAGLLLDTTYRYAKVSGDWDFVRTHLTALRDLLDAQTAMTDWALMSPLPRDACAADVLPDALRGALAMSQMAEAVKATESLRMARYLTARLLVPYVTGFATERSRPESRMPEFGCPTAWDATTLPIAVNRLAGAPMLPELIDVARANCGLQARKWVRDVLPQAFPAWSTQGDPAAAGEYCLLGHALDLPPAGPAFKAASERIAEDTPLGWQLAATGTKPPLRLAEWQPAALGAFVHDPEKGIVRLELTGATRLRCTMQSAPTEIRENGTPLPRSAWAYSYEQSRLLLPLGEGKHNLEIVYARPADTGKTP